MYCTHCGAQNADGVAFCVFCGAAMKQAEQPKPQQPQAPQYQQPQQAQPQQPQQTQPQAPQYQQPQQAQPQQPQYRQPQTTQYQQPQTPQYQQPQQQYRQPQAQPYQQPQGYGQTQYGQQPYQPYQQQAFGQVATKKKRTPLIVGIVAGVVVIAVVLILLLGGGGGHGSPTSVVKAMANALMKPDYAAAIDTVHPTVQQKMGLSKDSAAALNETAKATLDSMKALGYDYDLKVGSSTPITGSELTSLQDKYQTRYSLTVTEAQNVQLTTHMEFAGMENDSTDTIVTVKIDGKWYVDGSSFSIFS